VLFLPGFFRKPVPGSTRGMKGGSMKAKLFALWLLFLFLFTGILPYAHGREIRLMFPNFEMEERTSDKKATITANPKKGRGGKPVYSEKELSEFVKEFEKYDQRVDQIELSIEGSIESENVTRYFISLDGSGGCKVILKPK